MIPDVGIIIDFCGVLKLFIEDFDGSGSVAADNVDECEFFPMVG